MISQDNLISNIQQFLAAPPYQACQLLVHPDPAQLNAIIVGLIDRLGWPEWRVSESLSAWLLDVCPVDRPTTVAHQFRRAGALNTPGPVFVSDIALLFEPAFRLDPLRLLLDASRRKPLVVTWPGSVAGDRLAYAVPEHSHYRTWPRTELCPHCIVSLPEAGLY